jgi:hypothetical protein
MLSSRHSQEKTTLIHCTASQCLWHCTDNSVDRVRLKIVENELETIENERQIRLKQLFASAWANSPRPPKLKQSIPQGLAPPSTETTTSESSTSNSPRDTSPSPEAESPPSSVSSQLYNPWPPRRTCTIVLPSNHS